MKTLVLQVLMSLGILYHLLAVVLLPNPQSITGRSLGRLVIPYANQLGFNTTWQFFSPGPSPTFYLEYHVVKATEDDSDSGAHFYPPMRQGHSWDDRYNRRLYAMRFFSLDQIRMENYFVPWLCAQHPGAVELDVRYIFEPIPPIEKAESGTTFKDMSVRYEPMDRTFHCPDTPASESGENS